MSKSEWIMSNGGPLICMEKRLADTWGGTEFLSVPAPSCRCDYDRVCQSFDYTYTVPIINGFAVALGELKLQTSFWRSPAETLFLVQIFACEDDFDLTKAMDSLLNHTVADPHATTRLVFNTSDVTVFESAEQGHDFGKPYIEASVDPGAYLIGTQVFDPDPTCSLLLHRFDLIA